MRARRSHDELSAGHGAQQAEPPSGFRRASTSRRSSETARACARSWTIRRRLCAVVKADGYGHGAVQSARAALAGGASWLAVVAASEADRAARGGHRRCAGARDGRPDRRPNCDEALAADGDVVVWSESYLQEVAAAGGGRVHVKLDSGMGRLGTRDPDEAFAVAEAVARTPGVELAGAMTHFATADELEDEGFFASSWTSSRAGPSGSSRATRGARARRQQRCDAARRRGPVRHGPLRHRRLRHGSLRRGSRRARRSSRRWS